ncbi:hypothetical protein ACFL47_09790 [Candidatus Latescibacterota bacterium]
MQHNRLSYSRKAILYTCILHAALLALAWNITVLFEVDPPPFYELSLGSVSQQRLEQILDESRRTEAARRLREEGSTPEERVDVPKRKMIEIEEPTIRVSAEQRIETNDIINNAEKQIIEVAAPSFEPVPVRDSGFTLDRKQVYQGSRITVGEQPGAGIETGTIGRDVANFTIEGEIKGRDIMSNPLPEYPDGLNKNAQIKISFVVLPDGSVSAREMFPVKKENAVLEELAMARLKLWKFSALPEGSSRNQKGIITFEFKLE